MRESNVNLPKNKRVGGAEEPTINNFYEIDNKRIFNMRIDRSRQNKLERDC